LITSCKNANKTYIDQLKVYVKTLVCPYLGLTAMHWQTTAERVFRFLSHDSLVTRAIRTVQGLIQLDLLLNNQIISHLDGGLTGRLSLAHSACFLFEGRVCPRLTIHAHFLQLDGIVSFRSIHIRFYNIKF